MSATAEPFGTTPDGTPVERWTLTSGDTTVRVLSYGGVVQSLEVPDASGRVANVVLGFADLAGYLSADDPYLGALVGRYGNRIAQGRFTLDGETYRLPVNQGSHTLHGGPVGFSDRVWTVTDVSEGTAPALRLELLSEDGDQGFPGALTTTVTYRLDGASRLTVHYRATTDAPTVVNLTQHTYWNLAGEGSGDVHGHELQVDASGFTAVDAELVPTGVVAPVEGTPFDFRRPTPIGARIREADEQLLHGHGYDHNWVLDRGDADGGRTLRVLTTEPGIQVYSGNLLDGTLVGTGGRVYRQGDGVALETQHFPDSPNQPDFPSTELRPGQVYESTTVFELGG